MRKLTLILLITIATLLASPALARNEEAAGAKIGIEDVKLVKNSLRTKIKGTLTNISPDSLTIKTDGTSYTITIDSQTKLLRRFGGRSPLSEFSIGDEIMVVGTLNDDNKTSLTARLVRDLSIQKRHGLFVGQISSLTPTGFVLKTNQRGTQTVTITTNTLLLDRENQPITQSQFQVGHKVKLWGLWDKKLSTVQASKIRDLSLPPRTNTTASPSSNAR